VGSAPAVSLQEAGFGLLCAGVHAYAVVRNTLIPDLGPPAGVLGWIFPVYLVASVAAGRALEPGRGLRRLALSGTLAALLVARLAKLAWIPRAYW